MAKRRVFRTRATCPGVTADLGPACNQSQMIGKHVALEKAPSSEVNIVLNGVVVGHLDAAVESQVASAIDRGQAFTAVIKKPFRFTLTSSSKLARTLTSRLSICWRRVTQPSKRQPAGVVLMHLIHHGRLHIRRHRFSPKWPGCPLKDGRES